MSSPQVSRTPTLTCDFSPPKERSSASIDISEGIAVPLPNADATSYESLSPIRKLVLLGVFCSAQFFDVFNASAVLVSLPSVSISPLPLSLLWYCSSFHALPTSWRRLALRPWHPSMDPLCIHPNLRFLYAHRWHPLRYIPPQAYILPRFLVCRIPVGASVHPIMSIVFRALQGIGMFILHALSPTDFG